jgi:hypothetical protein
MVKTGNKEAVYWIYTAKGVTGDEARVQAR